MESLSSMLLAMQAEQEGLSCWDRPLTRENLLSGFFSYICSCVDTERLSCWHLSVPERSRYEQHTTVGSGIEQVTDGRDFQSLRLIAGPPRLPIDVRCGLRRPV